MPEQTIIAHETLSTTDASEFERFYAHWLAPTVVRPGAKLAGVSISLVRVDGTVVAWKLETRSNLEFRHPAGGPDLIVASLSLGGSVVVEGSNTSTVAHPNDILVGSMRSYRRVRLGAGRKVVALALAPGMLEKHLPQGGGNPAALNFLTTLDSRSPLGAAVLGYGLSIFDGLQRAAAKPPGQICRPRHFHAFAGLLVASFDNRQRAMLRGVAPPASLAEVSRAEAFMRANARRAIGIRDVAAAAGVSVRTLQYGFKRHLGRSPHAMLQQLRLEGVRAEILAGAPTKIADIALAWGFSNPGRFASLYRAAFGELPSQTQLSVATKD